MFLHERRFVMMLYTMNLLISFKELAFNSELSSVEYFFLEDPL